MFVKSPSKFLLLVSLLLFLSPTPIVVGHAQDVEKITYGKIATYKFTPDNTQAFFQFDAAEGDKVFLVTKQEEIAFGDELELDLRDSVGRSIGTKEEYVFRKFIWADLQKAGTYTVVVTYKNEDPNTLFILVNKTFVVGEEPVSVNVKDDTLGKSLTDLMILGVNVPKNGRYQLSATRTSGNLAFDAQLRDFADLFDKDVLSLGGSEAEEVNGIAKLATNGDYLLFIAPTLFHDLNTQATISVSLIPVK